jgi:ketosteroid isomerase-like protein
MKGTLETNVKRVLKSSDIALVKSEWSFNGIGPDGEAVSLTGKATDVLRQQSQHMRSLKIFVSLMRNYFQLVTVTM